MNCKNKFFSVILAFIMLFSLCILPACNSQENNEFTVKVMVEQGEHFQIIGESVREVNIGGNVAFYISIDEGYYYVPENNGVEFKDNQLIVQNVRSQQIIKVKVQPYVYQVKLHETMGMTIREGEELIEGFAFKEVPFGESAIFDIEIDEKYEYYQSVVHGDNVESSVVYENGQLMVENVRCNQEVFVQLREKAKGDEITATITLEESQAFTIHGENSKEVSLGTDVSFDIEIKEGYYYISNNCGAIYDEEEGKILFKNVQANQTMVLVFGKLNTTTKYYHAGKMEMTTVGENIIYFAEPKSEYVFSGWYQVEGQERTLYSYANNLTIPGTIASHLNLEPSFVHPGMNQIITYHANGGEIYDSEDTMIRDAFSHEIYLYPAALGEWCFKTFYRDGYVPLEYNTKADGSGTAISLGSRIFSDDKKVDLYLIWAEESKASEFTYLISEDENQGKEVTLTKYIGNNKNVVIPKYIEDIPVTIIDSDCFKNQDIESVVLSQNLITIENGAFENCTSLETVYMCDSIQNISDSCFTNCNQFKNLRMIAVLPPVYADHLIGATIRRFELLYSTRNDTQKNILFYAGSSTFQGIDGQTLADAFSWKGYRIINCAQNAFISGPLIMELCSYFMKEGDIMTFMPEYSPQLYSSCLELPSWIAIEAFYDAFRYIDLREYSNVFNAFYDLQHGSEGYVYVGKLQQLKDKQGFDYYSYDATFDQYFTRGNNFEVSQVALVPNQTPPDFEEMKSLVLSTINPLYNKLYKGKYTMYFAYFGLWENAYAGDVDYAGYEQWLKENLAFPYISNYQDHLFTLEHMSDSVSHLTREGAILHSEVIIQELQAQMTKDGY